MEHIDRIVTFGGWILIAAAALAARHQIARVYGMPTDLERIRSIRYRRAVRRSVKQRRRG